MHRTPKSLSASARDGFGSALAFDGVANYVFLGAAPLSSPWTAEFWVSRQDASDPAAALLSDSVSALKLEQQGTDRHVGFTRYGSEGGDYSFAYTAPTNTDIVVPKYLFYLLRTPDIRRRLIEVSSTAAITNISQDKIQDVEIPLPPLAEQRRIVAELDAEAAQMEAVRSLVPRFEAKIQRVLDRVWGNGVEVGA